MRKENRGNTSYTLKISLIGCKPPIWRRFCTPGDITLDRLHDAIQIIMGWDEKHLHRFEIEGRRFAEKPEDPNSEGVEESDFVLATLVTRPHTRFLYEYDFGDGWQHELNVESIDAVPAGHCACLGCMDGKRSCPPEDVGGVDGYAEFLAALKDSKHPEHDEYREWIGNFDANEFDVDAVNLELFKYARWSRPRSISQQLFVGGG